MIDTIVFDFGGVLIDWNPRYLYRDLFKDDAKMEWFLSTVCTNEWNLEQDKGRTFADGISLLQKDYPVYHPYIEAFYGGWKQMLKGEITETVAILKQLKVQYKIYGLTNWSAETFPIALQQFDFLQLFDGIVVSGAEKMVKPDKRFFKLLLNRYNLTADRCLFIDDNEQNIAAADELGFHTIHFASAEQLKSKLISMHVMN